jgi:hypothetical protein
MRFYYGAFGLIILSEIELFGLEPIMPDSVSSLKGPDVTIGLGKVPECLNVISATRKNVQTGPGEVLITHPKIARFLIRTGTRVIIEPLNGMSLSQVAMHVMGSCFGALLQQRKTLTLHGGAVKRKDRGVVLFLGRRGSGKSTLTAMMGDKGYDVLTDDLCAVDRKRHGYCMFAGIPSIKLCSKTLSTLRLDSTGFRTVQTHCEKYLIPVKRQMDQLPQDIERIYILAWGDSVDIAPVPMSQAVYMLRKNTFRRWMIKQTMGEKLLFETCGHIAQSTPVYAFIRPKELRLVKYSLGCLMEHFET